MNVSECLYQNDYFFAIWLHFDTIFNLTVTSLLFFKIVSIFEGWYDSSYNVTLIVFTSLFFAIQAYFALVTPIIVLCDGYDKDHQHLTMFPKIGKLLLWIKAIFWILPSYALDVFYITFLLFKGMGLWHDS